LFLQKTKSEDNHSNSDPVPASQAHAAVSAPLPAEELPDDIQYTAAAGAIPREVIFRFFEVCGAKLMDQNETDPLVRHFLSSGTPMSIILPLYQRKIMAWDCKIEPNFGCQYVASLPRLNPDDAEITNGLKRFTFVCMRAYVSCLRRAAELRTETLKTSGPFSAEMCNEFYEACNSLMAMPETKKSLRQIYEEKRKPPVERVIELQRSVFPWLGYDPDFGSKCLERSQQTIMHDPNRQRKQSMFLVCGDLAVKEAMMSPEERKAFYAEVPAYLHNAPHMYVMMKHHSMQQKQKMQQEQESREEPVASASSMDRSSTAADPAAPSNNNNNGGSGSGPASDSPESRLRDLLSSAEGRAQMAALQERIEKMKGDTTREVSDWTAAQREEFFEACDRNPKIAELSALAQSGAGGPMGQLAAFLRMPDEDLRNFVKLQAVLINDFHAGGDMGTRMVDMQRRTRDLVDGAQRMSLSSDHSHGHTSHGHHHRQHGHDHASSSGGGRGASDDVAVNMVPTSTATASSTMER
jgi:hypothetical protein